VYDEYNLVLPRVNDLENLVEENFDKFFAMAKENSVN